MLIANLFEPTAGVQKLHMTYATGAVLVLTAVWSALVPSVAGPAGAELTGVPRDVEIVDHVVPGVSIAALAAIGVVGLARAGATAPVATTWAARGAAFAAGWILLTHLPLLAKGGEPGHPWDAVAFHLAPSALVAAAAAAFLALTR